MPGRNNGIILSKYKKKSSYAFKKFVELRVKIPNKKNNRFTSWIAIINTGLYNLLYNS